MPFSKFSDEADRIAANLSQVYDGLLEVTIQLRSLPRYMTWRTVSGKRYLYQSIETPIATHSSPQKRKDKSLGVESDETLKIYAEFTEHRHQLLERKSAIRLKFRQTAALYKALRLPQVMSMPAKILFEMDVQGLLSSDFLVIGSTAFAAYEIEAGSQFMNGLDETEDFDLSWNPQGSISLLSSRTQDENIGQDQGQIPSALPSIFDVATSVDKSFEGVRATAHKLRNKNAFEIDILCDRGSHFKSEVAVRRRMFGNILTPLELEGQDILHLGQPLRHIVIGRDGHPAPLNVPDPRCMSLHKQWLSQQPERIPQKQRKDAKQAVVLWAACQHMPRFPTDNTFIESLSSQWAGIAKSLGVASEVVSDGRLGNPP